MSHLHRGRTRVSLHGGAVWIQVDDDAVLIDAPPGVADALGPDRLPHLREVLLSGGRIRSIGGLLALLCALEPHRGPEDPLVVRAPLGDDRGAALAELWSRHWPDRFRVVLDTERPGATFDAGPIEVRTFPVRAGEPRWRPDRVDPRVAIALRVQTPDLTIAVVLGAAPSAAVTRACERVDLAIVEVGVEPWPRTTDRWRLSVEEALELGAGVQELWLVGDDGRWLGGEEQ